MEAKREELATAERDFVLIQKRFAAASDKNKKKLAGRATTKKMDKAEKKVDNRTDDLPATDYESDGSFEEINIPEKK